MIDRRRFGLGASALTSTLVIPITGSPAESAQSPERGRLCLGLGGPSYFAGFSPFLNWWKVGGPLTLMRHKGGDIGGWDADGASPHLNDNGELKPPVSPEIKAISRIFYASPPGNEDVGHSFDGMAWTVEWNGKAKLAVGGLTGGHRQNIDTERGVATFTFGRKPENTWLTFIITDPRDPPRDIRLYQTQYQSAVKAGEIFNPDWINAIKPFGILRVMDWMRTNNSGISELSQFAQENDQAWCQPLPSSGNGPSGRRGGAPLSLITKLVAATGCDIHVCIPHRASDACVTAMAEHFARTLPPARTITFEYSNECWNYYFEQTRYCDEQAKSSADGSGRRWYGLRSAQCMEIVAKVFADRSRWRGCLATQTVNAWLTEQALLGVQDHLQSRRRTSSVADLFNEISLTGYFGDVLEARGITAITNARPAVVTSSEHGYADGQLLTLFIQKGMVGLNNRQVVVANAQRDSYELANVDTTQEKAFETANNFSHPTPIYALMDESIQKNKADPQQYKTRYQYFNEVMAQSWLTGEHRGITTEVNIQALRTKFWPPQKALATANGLQLCQYEGGLHFVGDGYLTGYGGEPKYKEFLINIGHTAETAAVYEAMYQAFLEIGGEFPSKYVEGGNTSEYGTWAGLRFIPGDEGNPVWQATLKANRR